MRLFYFLVPLPHLANFETDVALGASDYLLGTRAGAGGTATLA